MDRNTNQSNHSTCETACLWLLLVVILAAAALLAYTPEAEPGKPLSDKVWIAPCYVAGLAAGFCGRNATVTTVTTATTASCTADVKLNTTSVETKLETILSMLQFLVMASNNHSLQNAELREFLTTANFTLAANTAATDKSVKLHNEAKKEADNKTAIAKERLLSYNVGTAVSLVGIAAAMHVRTRDIRMVMCAVIPYVLTHGSFFVFSDWTLVTIIVLALSVFVSIGIHFYEKWYPRAVDVKDEKEKVVYAAIDVANQANKALMAELEFRRSQSQVSNSANTLLGAEDDNTTSAEPPGGVSSANTRHEMSELMAQRASRLT